jgi:hypothetical protein
MAIVLLVLKNNYNAEYGFTDMLRYSEKFEPYVFDEVKQVHRRIFPVNGSDGQFYANLALDPLLTHKNFNAAMDRPQYRSRRIFLPLCAFLIGHGNPALTLNAYAVGNFVFWIGLCILVFYKIRPRTLQEYACALTIIFSSGVFISAILALTDMPSTVLLFAALFFPFFWPMLFCCGVLTRETTFFFAPVFLVMEGLEKRKPSSIFLKTAIAILPIFLWWGYCMWHITDPVYLEKIRWIPDYYGFPFLAMLHRLGSIVYHFPKSFSPFQMQYFLTAISLTTQCTYFAVRRRPADPVWLTGAISAFFFAILGHVPWMEWISVLRMSLPMTFAFNLLLARENPGAFVKWCGLGNVGCIYFNLGYIYYF